MYISYVNVIKILVYIPVNVNCKQHYVTYFKVKAIKETAFISDDNS